MTQILLIDNSKDVRDSLTMNWKSKGIIIKSFSNHDDGYNELNANFYDYEGVILDARCPKDNLQEEQGLENDNYVFGIVKKVDQLCVKRKRHIPYCVYTGFSNVFKDNIEAMDVPVFTKGNSDKMLQFFRDEISKLEETNIKKEFPEAFEAFGENYLPKKNELLLININKLRNHPDIVDPETFLFNPVRKILEAIYKKIQEIEPRIITSEFIDYETDRVNLEWCQLRLSGKDVFKKIGGKIPRIEMIVTEEISWSLAYVTKIASIESHHSERTSKYLLNQIIYGLMAFLIWFKNYVDQH